MEDGPQPTQGRVSRRLFLGTAGTATAAAVLGGATNARAEALVSEKVRRRELRADVLVAGGGMGGLTAAVRAARTGASVIVIDKAQQPGGTMRESAGGVWTYESYEEMRRDAPEGNPDLQRALFDSLPLAFAFYDEIGAPLGAATDGRVRMRSIAPVAFTSFLVADLESHGGRLLVNTALLRLLTNSSNEVIGAVVDSPDGPVNILSRAVIVATGGWAGNAQMVQQNISRHFSSLHQRNCGFSGLQPALTGDGLLAATQVGAAVSDGGFDSFYGHLLPARPARFTHPLVNYSLYHGQWTVAVNLRGQRFADEARGRVGSRELVRTAEELINQETARQPEATAAYIWDHHINQTYALAGQSLGNIDKYEAFRQAGAPVARAETVEELAALMEGWNLGIPAEQVVRNLTDYNDAAGNGRAWALPVPKQSAEHAIPLTQPPYYAVLGQTGITGPMGGLKADPQGRVLSRGGRPIPGLYAAGIDIGNIGDHVYLGFLGYGAAFGFISGGNAARQPEPSGGWEVAGQG